MSDEFTYKFMNEEWIKNIADGYLGKPVGRHELQDTLIIWHERQQGSSA
ncbi:hypothetical protein ACFL67_02930 [candidate division KSB1 bacterium]